jgi:hypothetical protein
MNMKPKLDHTVRPNHLLATNSSTLPLLHHPPPCGTIHHIPSLQHFERRGSIGRWSPSLDQRSKYWNSKYSGEDKKSPQSGCSDSFRAKLQYAVEKIKPILVSILVKHLKFQILRT